VLDAQQQEQPTTSSTAVWQQQPSISQQQNAPSIFAGPQQLHLTSKQRHQLKRGQKKMASKVKAQKAMLAWMRATGPGFAPRPRRQ
jgi:hypothetical protein